MCFYYRIRQWLVMLLVCGYTGATLAQLQLYRYKNGEGTRVISATIPPEFVAQGYDIIRRDGTLIERVPPGPSEAEKAAQLAASSQKKRLAEWDQKLLSRYSHVDDIEEAKMRKLAQFQNDIAIIERNIEKITVDINQQQALAANEERQGLPVSQSIVDHIEQLKRNRQRENHNRQAKLHASKALAAQFERDIERFRIIRPEQQPVKNGDADPSR